MSATPSSECEALLSACTLSLYEKNIFRVTGLPVDATAKEVAKQVQKLQMLAEMGGESATSKAAFSRVSPPTNDEIREALARMKDPEHRIVDEFFWYWPERFGESKNDPAIQAVLAGNSNHAAEIWQAREDQGSTVARHNIAVMFHMSAVDWTHYQTRSALDQKRAEKIKEYWRESLSRWEDLIDSDALWSILKDRIRSMEDDALTTGFVRRLQRLLPQALDRVNAEAALKLAEFGLMDWAEFHVNLMNETHQGLDDVESTAEMVLAPTKARVEQHLLAFNKKTNSEPKNGTTYAVELLLLCKPMIDLFDLFHGVGSYQRNDLFDKVAQTVVKIARADWEENHDARKILPIFEKALELASGTNLRDQIKKEISDINKVIALAPIFEALKEIHESKDKSRVKLQRITKSIIPQLPALSQQCGYHSKSFMDLSDTVAVVLKGISVNAYNDENDGSTALTAIRIASGLARKPDLKERIATDAKTLEKNTGTADCYYCGSQPGDGKYKVEVPMHKVTERLPNGVRYTD